MKLSTFLPTLLAAAVAATDVSNLHVANFEPKTRTITVAWDLPTSWDARYAKILYRVHAEGLGGGEEQYEIAGDRTSFDYAGAHPNTEYLFKVEGGWPGAGYSNWVELRYTTPKQYGIPGPGLPPPGGH